MPANNGPAFSEAEIALMLRLWGEGASASEIASHIGAEIGASRSRNAVLGYMHRHRAQFPKRGKSAGGKGVSLIQKIERQRAAAPAAKQHLHAGTEAAEAARIAGKKESRAHDPVYVAPAPVATEDRISPHAYDLASRQVPLDQLKHGECRWPVNDAAIGELHLFCGKPNDVIGNYCRHHRLRSIGAGTPSERGAVAVLARRALPAPSGRRAA
ncbi:MAG TPA: GcrA family cell cycle regulator [Rhizobiaceae bacterium]|nr:GcrA family cell cycle regulator [Rhizobiaceae bacterium]